jgi:hypothetical protein
MHGPGPEDTPVNELEEGNPVEELHLTLESLARWMPDDDSEPDPLVQVAVLHLVERCPICRKAYEDFRQMMGPATSAPCVEAAAQVH